MPPDQGESTAPEPGVGVGGPPHRPPGGAARMTARHTAFVVLREPFTRHAWREVLYCLAGFPLGLAGFVLVVVLLAVGAALTTSLIGAFLGLVVLVGTIALARGLCAVHRMLAGSLLGERLPPAAPVHRGIGVLGRLDARLRDGVGWRSMTYVLVKLPISVLGLYMVFFWCAALVDLTAPVRWAVFGQHPGPDVNQGMPVITPFPFGGFSVNTFEGTYVAVAVGLAVLLLAPWLTHAVVAADRWLVRALLGPAPLAQRVRDLEETRALAVDDSAAVLRRLERDLHDGAQVRLVALAMSLDMAREKLDGNSAEPLDADRVRQLVEIAHRNATEALTELRDLARGIHPPALDDGLPDALATLAARSPVPVALTVDVPIRPTAAIESIAYFCAAELLTNVIKHSDARRAVIDAAWLEETLCLSVTDNGRGGAVLGGGSGLAGLAQRVRTVDGSLHIRSPAGGPTVVTVRLPLHA